jgi:tripartite-type tricarboxylate transporter receptor subunit TctC
MLAGLQAFLHNEIMKRAFLLLLAALMLGPQAVEVATALEYPTRQITLIAPWPAGGAIDTLCRVLAPYLAERLGKPVVVENRPGAASVIGTAAGAKSAPDGYTLVMAGSGSLAISATIYKKLPYDPVKDFAPIGLVARIPFVLVVNPSLPVHRVAELVQYAKEHPGELSYASGGPGSPHHLQAVMLKGMTGIEMTHVPYKGSAPALTDVIAGHVPLMFSDAVPALPQIKEGKVRALGVSTAARLPSAPEIPPLAEVGVPGFDAAGWGVISVPAGTPEPIVARLRATLNGILPLPEVAQQIIAIGLLPAGAVAPEETARFINAEIERWGKVIRQAGLAGSE